MEPREIAWRISGNWCCSPNMAGNNETKKEVGNANALNFQFIVASQKVVVFLLQEI